MACEGKVDNMEMFEICLQDVCATDGDKQILNLVSHLNNNLGIGHYIIYIFDHSLTFINPFRYWKNMRDDVKMRKYQYVSGAVY